MKIIRFDDPEEDSAAICLDSSGRSYVGGKMMNLLREDAIGTVIESHARCCSAWSLIFMAGHLDLEEGLSTPWRYLHYGGGAWLPCS